MTQPLQPIDLPDDDDDPVPEAGVARAPEPTRVPSHHAQSAAGRKKRENMAPAVRAADPPRDLDTSADEKAGWPTALGPLWLKILSWLPTQKVNEREATPDDVGITVLRVSGGGQAGGVTFPEPIEGGEVVGDESESADAALQRILTERFHLYVSDERSRATFRCKFYWRIGGRGDIKTSEPLMLPSPLDIKRSRKSTGDAGTTLERGGDGGGKDYLHGRLEAELEALRRENEQARREGRAPKPVEQLVAPAGAQPGDWAERLRLERELAEARAKAASEEAARKAAETHAAETAELRRQLDAMKAAQEREVLERRLAEMERRISQPQASQPSEIIQVLQTLGLIQVGPDGKPIPVGAGQPYTSPGITPEDQILNAAKVMADARAAEEKTRETLRRAYGFQDPKTEIVQAEAEEKEEPGFLDKYVMPVVKGIVSHPEGPLTALAHIANGSPLGEMAKGAAAAVSAGRAAVNASKSQAPGVSGGVKPPSA